jgi:hypothetical protein
MTCPEMSGLIAWNCAKRIRKSLSDHARSTVGESRNTEYRDGLSDQAVHLFLFYLSMVKTDRALTMYNRKVVSVLILENQLRIYPKLLKGKIC